MKLTKNYGPIPAHPILTLTLSEGRVSAVTLRGVSLELPNTRVNKELYLALLHSPDVLRMALSMHSEPSLDLREIANAICD